TLHAVANEVRVAAIVVAVAELRAEPEIVEVRLHARPEEAERVHRVRRARVEAAPLIPELAEPGAESDVRRARVSGDDADASARAAVRVRVRVALRTGRQRPDGVDLVLADAVGQVTDAVRARAVEVAATRRLAIADAAAARIRTGHVVTLVALAFRARHGAFRARLHAPRLGVRDLEADGRRIDVRAGAPLIRDDGGQIRRAVQRADAVRYATTVEVAPRRKQAREHRVAAVGRLETGLPDRRRGRRTTAAR